MNEQKLIFSIITPSFNHVKDNEAITENTDYLIYQKGKKQNIGDDIFLGADWYLRKTGSKNIE